MRTLFGVEWDQLELSHVRVFLEGAEDEPLLWEAKGTKIDPHHVRKTVGGFANSHDGGYLILGASQTEDGWDLGGVEFPDEPPKWISSVVHDGLRPAPRVGVHAFKVEQTRRHVAVVRVLPLDEPPCVSRGTVHERIPGQTLAVKDPQRLAELYSRGDRARKSARERADRASTVILELFGEHYPRPCRVAVAVAPLEVPQPSVTTVLFSSPFESTASEWVRERVRYADGPIEGKVLGVAGQDAISVSGSDPFDRHAWRLRAAWDGTVAVAHMPSEPGTESLELVRTYVTTAWSAGLRLAEQLGCGPSYCLAIRVDGTQWTHKAESATPGPALVRRGPIRVGTSEELVDDVMAELERVQGRRI
jgi:hypothetical protein